jgi:hypothetical protein
MMQMATKGKNSCLMGVLDPENNEEKLRMDAPSRLLENYALRLLSIGFKNRGNQM